MACLTIAPGRHPKVAEADPACRQVGAAKAERPVGKPQPACHQRCPQSTELSEAKPQAWLPPRDDREGRFCARLCP